MSDDLFLRSEEWRRVRMLVLERDGAKCACCGKTAADGVIINVDHIKPRRFHPELALTPSNLQVLCDGCNHGKGNRFETDWRRAPPSMPVLSTFPMRVELRALLTLPRKENVASLGVRNGKPGSAIEAAVQAVAVFVGDKDDGNLTSAAVLEHFIGTEHEAVILRELEVESIHSYKRA